MISGSHERGLYACFGEEKVLPAFGVTVKKLIAPALFAALALTGCAAAATPAPAATTPGVPMAKPTEAQKAALMAELAKIDPKLEGARALVDARLSCRSILKGDPEEVQIETTRQRFSTGSGTITEAEAKQIIEIVKANGFCVKA
jgi:hypothetical protein